MKGLMRKDLYMIFEYGRSLLVMSAIFLAVSVVAQGENFFFVVYPVLFAGILPVTLISYEERDGWNSLCDTMPVSRKTVVNERYVMTLCCFLAFYLITLAVQGGVLIPKGRTEEFVQLVCVLPGVGLIAPAIMIPVTLRWGVEKGRLVYYAFIGVTVLLGLVGANYLGIGGGEIAGPGMWAVPLAAAAGFGLSWLIAVKIYEKREL